MIVRLLIMPQGAIGGAEETLMRTSLVYVYEMIGQFPPDLFDRQGDLGLSDPDAGPSLIDGEIIGDVSGTIRVPTDMAFDSDGNLWIADDYYSSAEPYVRIFAYDPQTGTYSYSRSMQVLSEHLDDSGHRRAGELDMKSYIRASGLTLTANGGIGVWVNIWGDDIFQINDAATGRYGNPLGGETKFSHANMTNVVAGSDGSLYYGADGSLYKRDAYGELAYECSDGQGGLTNKVADFTGVTDIAVDSNGRIYAINATEIRVYLADGSLHDSYALDPAGGDAQYLDVSPDGGLVVVTTNTQKLWAFVFDGNDELAVHWQSGTYISAPKAYSIYNVAVRDATTVALTYKYSSGTPRSCLYLYDVSSGGLSNARTVGLSQYDPPTSPASDTYLTTATTIKEYNG